MLMQMGMKNSTGSCPCGATFSGAPEAVKAAFDAHNQEVHGQEPDALDRKLKAHEKANIQLVGILGRAKEALKKVDKDHPLAKKIEETLRDVAATTSEAEKAPGSESISTSTE